jgi:hypothetical protein
MSAGRQRIGSQTRSSSENVGSAGDQQFVERVPRVKRQASSPAPPLTLLHPIPSRSTNAREQEEDFHAAEPSRSASTNQFQSQNGGQRKKSWKSLGWIGRGMRRDIRTRAPYYLSDWTDAWNYRVVPASWVRLGFGSSS